MAQAFNTCASAVSQAADSGQRQEQPSSQQPEERQGISEPATSHNDNRNDEGTNRGPDGTLMSPTEAQASDEAAAPSGFHEATSQSGDEHGIAEIQHHSFCLGSRNVDGSVDANSCSLPFHGCQKSREM